VPVPLWIAGKLALYQAIREAGISNSELARRLHVRETIVRRMLDPDHETKAERLQAALLALGKQLVIAVQNAA
jgi:antitoxin HicB